MRAALEGWMEKHEYQSDFARRYFQQGARIERGLQRAVLALARAVLARLGLPLTRRLRSR